MNSSLHNVAHIYRVWFLHVLPPQEVTIEEKSSHLLEIIINNIEIQNNNTNKEEEISRYKQKNFRKKVMTEIT